MSACSMFLDSQLHADPGKTRTSDSEIQGQSGHQKGDPSLETLTGAPLQYDSLYAQRDYSIYCCPFFS